MTFTTNRFDSHFRKFSSGFMHKQQIFNHQVEFCRYNPQIEMFARFKMKSSFHKTKRII